MVSERFTLPFLVFLALAIVVAAAVNQSLSWHTAQEIVNSGGQVFDEQGKAYLCDSTEEPTDVSDVDSLLSHPIGQISINSTDPNSIDSDGNGWPDVGIKVLSLEEVNLATLPDSTTECPSGGANCDNINDDNEDTYYSRGCGSNYNPQCGFSYEAIVNFNEVMGSVNKVEFVYRAAGAGGSDNTIYLYYGGDWHEVYNIALGAGYPYFDSGKVTSSVEGSWSNVEKVKLAVSGFGVYSSSIMTATLTHYLYELRAFGTALPPDMPSQPPAGDPSHPISQIRRGVSGAENQKIDSNNNGWPDKCDSILDIPGTVHYWVYGPTVTCGAGQPPTCPSFTPDCSSQVGQECDTPGLQTGWCEFVGVYMTAGPGSLGFCKCATLVCE